MKRVQKYCFLLVISVLPLGGSSLVQAVDIFSDSGPNASSITDTVDAFRKALGTFNAPAPVNAADGRRQIDWDAAPGTVSAPNGFPGDFFNFNASPRARGIEFATPGSGFQLSGDFDDGTPKDFTNINPTYDTLFEAFSPERLFTPIGSNIVDVTFFDPANNDQPAVVDGLGVVFSDVDFQNVSRMDFYDSDNNNIGSYDVPNYVAPPTSGGGGADNEHFSFLGVKFDDEIISRVRIYAGTDPLGVDEDLNNSIDLVVMDDFIFGEPVPVPEPSSTALLSALGLVGLGLRRRS